MSTNNESMSSIETLLAVWFFAAMLLIQKSCNYIEDWKISRHQQFLDTHEPFVYGVSLDDGMICFSTVEEYDKWLKSVGKPPWDGKCELPTVARQRLFDNWRGHQMFLYRWGGEIWSFNTVQGVRFFQCDDGEHDTYLDLFREKGVDLEEIR